MLRETISNMRLYNFVDAHADTQTCASVNPNMRIFELEDAHLQNYSLIHCISIVYECKPGS
jgi:hypothetical protein